MTTWREDLHPRADDGRFGHVAGEHEHEQPQQHGGHGTMVALGVAGAALAGGTLTLVGTGHAGRLYRFTRNAMLDDTHLDRVIYGNANLRRLALRMAAGERREVSRYFAPESHSMEVITAGRGVPIDEGLYGPITLDAKRKAGLIRQIIDAADPAETPKLYRAIYLGEELEPEERAAGLLHSGDEIDFGPFASWSSKRTVAEAFGDSIFHLEAGQVKALRLSDSYLDEWLAGGRFRIIGRAFDGVDWHYNVVPVGAS